MPCTGLPSASAFQSTLPTRGSDEAMCRTALCLRISIHAPHEGERRGAAPPPSAGLWDFNPRSPRGGATCYPISACHRVRYFNPRSPRGGATIAPGRYNSPKNVFQSTLPTRGSDRYAIIMHGFYGCISIHAPHEGERRRRNRTMCGSALISIHAPHEGERRLRHFWRPLERLSFQSTLPTRGSD